MSIEELKQRVLNGQQHYFNKEQVIELLDKLEKKKPSGVLTLF
jgi:hypothetical protein